MAFKFENLRQRSYISERHKAWPFTWTQPSSSDLSTFLSIPRCICSVTLPLPYAFVHWRRFIHHHIPLCAPKLYSHKFPNLLLYLYASTTCHRGSLTFIHAAMQNNSIPLACRPLFPVLNLPPRHALSSFATECPFCLALHFDEEKGSFCCHEALLGH